MIIIHCGVVILVVCAGKEPNFVQILKKIVNLWPAERYYYCSLKNRKIRSI